MEQKRTGWTDRELALTYLEKAEVLIPVRRRLRKTLASFYQYYLGENKGANILELGCGDGSLIEELLKLDDTIKATLVDGSDVMLEKAKERLSDYKGVDFIKASFEELVVDDKKVTPEEFDFVLSALAIHHVSLSERGQVIDWIYSHVATGGWFVNFEVCLSPSDGLEQWYQRLWEERILEKKEELAMEVDHGFFMQRHRDREHHAKLETIEAHLAGLKKAGFKDVDCFYKHGLFAMYGGRK